MADTLATIRSRISFKCGAKAGINSIIDENLNEAILQVIQEAKPEEMMTTTTWSTSSATAAYTFATIGVTNVLIPLYVRNNTDDYELKHRSYEEWDRYRQATSSSDVGNPHLWTRLTNSVILFAQIPDSSSRTMQLTYLQKPTRLSADSDTFPLNDEWKRPAEELAAAMTLRDINSPQAEGKFAAYQAMMLRRISIPGEESATPEGMAFIPISNLNMSN